jgi:ABC-2 type transport system permease protein
MTSVSEDTMTTAATPRPHRARREPGSSHYGFGNVARMEWIKLRSLRSTWVTLALTVAAAAGISVAVGLNTRSANEDLTSNALAGVSAGLLLIGVLGVMVATSEYTSGMIKTTLAAIPNRPLVLAAKAAVFGAIALLLGEAASFISFFGGGLSLRHGIAAPTLGHPGALRAVLLTGASYCLIGLIGLGLGVIIRHTAAAVAVMVGGVYVAAQFIASIAHTLYAYIPISIVANSLSTTRPVGAGVYMLSPWAGLGLLCLYAAVLLTAGGVLLTRRDA